MAKFGSPDVAVVSDTTTPVSTVLYDAMRKWTLEENYSIKTSNKQMGHMPRLNLGKFALVRFYLKHLQEITCSNCVVVIPMGVSTKSIMGTNNKITVLGEIQQIAGRHNVTINGKVQMLNVSNSVIYISSKGVLDRLT
jgi:hypothetical protein